MRWLAAWLTLVALACSGVAHAQPSDEAKRATVRTLGYEGIEHYQAGEYQEAFDKLDRSYSLIKVPTLGMWSARALQNLGRWVEASERYFDVMRLELPELEGEVHAQAQADAAKERAALLPKIPKLTIVIMAGGDDVIVSLDDKAVPRALLDAPLAVDPGEHRITAARGEQRVERSVTLEASARAEVVLDVPAPTPEPVVAPVAPQPAPVAPPKPARDKPTSPQWIVGWAAVAFGGGALIAGVTMGVVAAVRAGDLDCPEEGCDPSVADEVETVNDLRLPSTVWIIAGAAGAGLGTVLLLTAPNDGGDVALRLGPARGELRVRF